MNSWQTLDLIARTDGAHRKHRGESLYAMARADRSGGSDRLRTAFARLWPGAFEPTSHKRRQAG